MWTAIMNAENKGEHNGFECFPVNAENPIAGCPVTVDSDG
jgi:hypothetical protein